MEPGIKSISDCQGWSLAWAFFRGKKQNPVYKRAHDKGDQTNSLLNKGVYFREIKNWLINIKNSEISTFIKANQMSLGH